jgi:hypothetical protein
MSDYKVRSYREQLRHQEMLRRERENADATIEVNGWTWCFSVDEVSMCVYGVQGTDEAGRRVEETGTDPDRLLETCKTRAAEIANSVEPPPRPSPPR